MIPGACSLYFSTLELKKSNNLRKTEFWVNIVVHYTKHKKLVENIFETLFFWWFKGE